jgi:uncharacterized RDD family membrane protein YckC
MPAWGRTLTPAHDNSQPPITNYQTGDRALRQLASLGERLGGQFLDALVAGIPMILGSAPWGFSDDVHVLTTSIGAALGVSYLLFSDGFDDGQSFGKRVMSTSVVDSVTGEPCTFGQSFLRNFLLMVLGVIDWIFVFGRKRQRVGDIAAGTIVVRTYL